MKYIFDIPCDLIKTLESDVEQAQKFVEQLLDGKTPSLIKKSPQQIPEEVVEAFQDVIGIFETLPSEIKDVADAAVSDVAKVFDDIGSGNIVEDLKSISGVVVSGITSGWGDLTAGLEDGRGAATNFVGCFFNSCPHTTADAYTCNGLYATPTSANATSARVALADPTGIKPENKTTFQLNNSTRISASGQPPSITPFPTQTRLLTVSTRFPQPSASAKAGSGGLHMIDSPSVLQLCGLFAIGVVGIALLL